MAGVAISVHTVTSLNTGVERVGPVANTAAPEPVSSVSKAFRLALVGVVKNVAAPVASPETPVEIGRPVALVKVTLLGVPRAGVTSVGDVANTAAPVPVSSVKAARRLALLGVAKKAATFVPRPEMPVETGRPVALVRTAALGVPRAGVTRVGDVLNTTSPVPVSSVNCPARAEEEKVPMAENGMLVKVLLEPDMLLPVRVCVPASDTRMPEPEVKGGRAKLVAPTYVFAEGLKVMVWPSCLKTALKSSVTEP